MSDEVTSDEVTSDDPSRASGTGVMEVTKNKFQYLHS